jgi:hypothetical protein
MSNEVGHYKSFFLGVGLLRTHHPLASKSKKVDRCVRVFTRRAQFCVASSLGCSPPTISLVTVDQYDLCELPPQKGGG